MLCSLRTLESVCRKELWIFPSLPALLGLLLALLIPHSFLHWPNATWVSSSFHFWKQRSKDIFISAVFCSSQAQLRCVSGLFVEGIHPLPLLHHFFLIPPVPTWRHFNLFFSWSCILVACEALHAGCSSRAILLFTTSVIITGMWEMGVSKALYQLWFWYLLSKSQRFDVVVLVSWNNNKKGPFSRLLWFLFL